MGVGAVVSELLCLVNAVVKHRMGEDVLVKHKMGENVLVKHRRGVNALQRAVNCLLCCRPYDTNCLAIASHSEIGYADPKTCLLMTLRSEDRCIVARW